MNKKRLCCFYVNDIHLITMLLPYINERIEEGTEVIAISEIDMSGSAQKVMEGVLGKRAKSLEKIDWTAKNVSCLQKCDVKNKLILVSGQDEFISEANKIIDNKKERCTILDCYEIMQGSRRLQEILEAHDSVVNTSGEKRPDEVFTGFMHRNYDEITL